MKEFENELNVLSGWLGPNSYEYGALALVMILASLVPIPRGPLKIAAGAIVGLAAIPRYRAKHYHRRSRCFFSRQVPIRRKVSNIRE
jgi:hypothetical protein